MRKTSEVPNFPWHSDHLCWITVQIVGKAGDEVIVRQPATRWERRQALIDCVNGTVQLFIAWPGRYSTDLFEADDVSDVTI